MVEMRLLLRQEGRGKRMKVTATISLTIDIHGAREMGLEIDDSDVESYAIDETADFIYECIKRNDLHDIIKVEIVKEDANV